MKYLKAGIYWLITNFGGVKSWQVDNISVCKLIREIIWGMFMLACVVAFVTFITYSGFMALLYTPFALLYETYIENIGYSVNHPDFVMGMYMFYGLGLIIYTGTGIGRLIIWCMSAVREKSKNKQFNNKSVKSTWFASIGDKVCYYVDITDWKLEKK
jgi:hypothetical protein